LFIDDDSDDGTHEIIQNWLTEHPNNNVEYIRNPQRLGGTANTVQGFGMAPASAIVMEVNGDDWLSDRRVAQFFNKIYTDDDVWMTYNTLRFSNGPPAPWARKWPTEVIRENAFRDSEDWTTGHLHTFRKGLFDHVDEEAFIDPATGNYWECADDQAIYLSLFELAGTHSKNINRISYVYNFNESSHAYADHEKSKACAARIRAGKRYQPIDVL
jgi:glycosyltransferase involved in cell wall biosynthesis